MGSYCFLSDIRRVFSTADSLLTDPSTTLLFPLVPLSSPRSFVRTEESTCFNGIPGLQVGDACCDPGCTKCGGVNCSQEAVSIGLTEQHCCVDTIISAGLVCGEDVMDAPCISYGEQCREVCRELSSCSHVHLFTNHKIKRTL